MGIGFQAKVGEFENWDIRDLELEKEFFFRLGLFGYVVDEFGWVI